MSTEPPGYGRTKMLAEISQGMAQVAYARLDLLERAFAALPGAEAVDVEGLAAKALADLAARTPGHGARPDDQETIAEAVARMRGQA